MKNKDCKFVLFIILLIVLSIKIATKCKGHTT